MTKIKSRPATLAVLAGNDAGRNNEAEPIGFCLNTYSGGSEMRNFMVLVVGVLLLNCGFVFFFAGCSEDSNTVEPQTVEVQKDTVPFPPQGVGSVTGDGYVVINWLPNWESQLGEKDLGGYVIYRSLQETENYEEIGRVGVDITTFTDRTVKNGVTYFYAVSAVDQAGNESDLSVESVFDTPRPAGSNVVLEDYSIVPQASGFSFIHSNRVQDFNNGTTDFYFGVDTEVMVPYIYSDNGAIQDMGWTDSFDEISFAPTQGFTSLFVEAIIGHTYVFLTPDGHYAKIRITDVHVEWAGEQVRDASIQFDWAYQLQAGNPELAPPAR